MLLTLLTDTLLKLLQSAVPGVPIDIAKSLLEKLLLLATSPDEFWVQFNIAVAELAEGKTPSIIGEVEQLAGDLFGQAVQP